MRATKDIAEAIVDWVVAVVPQIEGTYDHATGHRTQPQPDVAVEIQNMDPSMSATDQFPARGIEQAMFMVRAYNVTLVVPSKPEEEASDKLSDMIDALLTSLYADLTLGGRVTQVGILPRATFNPPFVEYDDRTRGRQATLELQVGEFLETEE